MTNLPVPTPASEVTGNTLTAALWNANVYNGLTYLLNPPVFFGVQATAQTLSTSGSNYAITMDTGVVDSYGGHSGVTNPSRYTAQVAGWYRISGCVGYAPNGTGFRAAVIRVNGSPVQGGASEIPVSSGTYATTVPTPVVLKYLSVGDYVEVYAWQTSGGSLSTTAFADQACSMSVQWIHT